MANDMVSFNMPDISARDRHALLLSLVGPRPIAFAATISAAGAVNLSPFSFFNMFSTNPPVAIFSPSRRGRDGTLKDTHLNLLEVPEVTLNMVSYAMVQQMSLSSGDYPRGIDEFEKAGFAAAPSVLVRPPRVAEAPACLECRVSQIMELGGEGASGNLVFCEVLMAHIQPWFVDANGHVEAAALDLIGRMGGEWYCRAGGSALFQVPKPGRVPGIGVDQLPSSIRYSGILTGNDLGVLGGATALPGSDQIDRIRATPEWQTLETESDHDTRRNAAHEQIQALLQRGLRDQALAFAFACDHW